MCASQTSSPNKSSPQPKQHSKATLTTVRKYKSPNIGTRPIFDIQASQYLKKKIKAKNRNLHSQL